MAGIQESAFYERTIKKLHCFCDLSSLLLSFQASLDSSERDIDTSLDGRSYQSHIIQSADDVDNIVDNIQKNNLPHCYIQKQ